MSYGVEFINDYGENVLRSSGLFFEKYSGTLSFTVNWQNKRYCESTMHLGVYQNHEFCLAARSFYAANTMYYQDYNGNTLGTWYRGVNGHGGTYDSRLIQWSGDRNNPDRDPGLGTSNTGLMPKAIPNSTGMSVSGFHEVFFKMPSAGLHHFGSVYNPFSGLNTADGQGLTAWAQAFYTTGEGLEYKLVGTQPPAVSGSYGIKVDDANSNTVYDSRYVERAVRIKDHIYVSKADIDDVLINNAVKYYPLRQNVTTPWIGGDTSCSARRGFGYGTTWWFPLFQIERINGVDNLKISNVRYRWPAGGSSTAYPHYHSNPGTYLIADM